MRFAALALFFCLPSGSLAATVSEVSTQPGFLHDAGGHAEAPKRDIAFVVMAMPGLRDKNALFARGAQTFPPASPWLTVQDMPVGGLAFKQAGKFDAAHRAVIARALHGPLRDPSPKVVPLPPTIFGYLAGLVLATAIFRRTETGRSIWVYTRRPAGPGRARQNLA